MKKLILFLSVIVSLAYSQDVLHENIFQYEIYRPFILELANCDRITVYADNTGIFELRTEGIFQKDINKYCITTSGTTYYIDMRTKHTYIIIPNKKGLHLFRY